MGLVQSAIARSRSKRSYCIDLSATLSAAFCKSFLRTGYSLYSIGGVFSETLEGDNAETAGINAIRVGIADLRVKKMVTRTTFSFAKVMAQIYPFSAGTAKDYIAVLAIELLQRQAGRLEQTSGGHRTVAP